MIRTKSLQFSYSPSAEFDFPDIQSNETGSLLIGPSGIGKTTFLHLLAGILRPQKGDIYWENTNLNTLKESELDKLRGKHLGLVFQKNHFIESLTILDNVLLPAKLNGIKNVTTEARETLERLSIGKKADSLPHQLSEGEKQRANIARALLHKPSYLLADEPTSSLDDTNAAEVICLLKQECSINKTHLIIITHDQRLKTEFEHTINLAQ